MNPEALPGLNPIFSKRQYKNWTDLEQEIIKIASTTEKGDAFEQFCYFYLFYHRNLYQIEEIWSDKIKGREIPSEIREKYKLEPTDYGVDGVSRLTGNRIEGWQAKFRSDQSAPTVTELATFWTESEYCDSKRTLANTTRLPVAANKKINHEQTLLDKFIELKEDFFASLFLTAATSKIVIQPKKFVPRPHQEDMVTDVINGLKIHSRGKLIAACGTGKTLAALWIVERMDVNRVLILVPSISLVGQTVREWVEHGSKDFKYLCICSDKTIVNEIENPDEEADIPLEDIDFPVTTTPEEVAKWLVSNADSRQYIFSTYHSIPVLEAALQSIEGATIDLTIFDEAHRTVGRADQFFARGLDDKNIPSVKRLFMTATERMVNPIIKTLAKKSGTEVFSMDDEAKYGPILHDFNFGRAIDAGVIADYEIVLAMINDKDELDLIQKNAYVVIGDADGKTEQTTLSADLLFKAAFLIKTLAAGESEKVITFHSSRRNAMIFNRALGMIRDKITTKFDAFLTYVLGDQNSGERSVRIAKFENAPIGVLGNVQVLSEGVDIPLVDSVYFVDPKNSLVDIVQAIGRALRKPDGVKKIARVIVPFIIPENITSLDQVPWDDSLTTFHAVIQSMRDQDHRLTDEIDKINEYAITRGKQGLRLETTSSISRKIKLDPRELKLPTGVSLEDFLEKISFRIASANANPTGAKIGFSSLGKGERKSSYKPILGFLGDYNPDTYLSSLIKP